MWEREGCFHTSLFNVSVIPFSLAQGEVLEVHLAVNGSLLLRIAPDHHGGSGWSDSGGVGIVFWGRLAFSRRLSCQPSRWIGRGCRSVLRFNHTPFPLTQGEVLEVYLAVSRPNSSIPARTGRGSRSLSGRERLSLRSHRPRPRRGGRAPCHAASRGGGAVPFSHVDRVSEVRTKILC